MSDIWEKIFKTLPNNDDYTDSSQTKLSRQAINKLVNQDGEKGWKNFIFDAFYGNRFREQINLDFQISYLEKTA